jgi:tetratricopeptide (TPR) repeat protein
MLLPKGLSTFLLILLSLYSNADISDSLIRIHNEKDEVQFEEKRNNWLSQLQNGQLSEKDVQRIRKSFVQTIESEKDETLVYRYVYSFGLFEKLVVSNGARALHQFENAFHSAELNGDSKGMASALWQSMSILTDLHLYEEALQYLFRVEAVLQKYNYQGFSSLSLKMLEMGQVFFQTENYEVAIQYFDKALAFKNGGLNKSQQMHARNTLGLAYQRTQSYVNAIANFEKSHQLAEEIGDKFWSALTYGNIGAVLFEQGKYDLALERLLFDYEKSQELGVWNSAANAAVFMARIRIKEKNFLLAKGILEKALQIDAKGSEITTRRNIYMLLSEVNNEMKDYKLAFEYGRLYSLLNDSIQTARIESDRVERMKQFTFQIQEKERLLEQKQIEVNKYSSKLNMLQSLLIGAMVMLFIVFVYFFKRRNSHLKEIKTKLEQDIEKRLLEAEKRSWQKMVNYARTNGHTGLESLFESSDIDNFKHRYDAVNNHFFARLKASHPEINQDDIHRLVLVQTGISLNDIYNILNSSPEEWQNWENQLKRKLNGKEGDSLKKLMVELN